MNSLPARFLRITAFRNPLVKRLERLRTSKEARQEEGHVLVQGIKTLEELASKGHHRIRTIGITFDEHNLPIRSPALDIVASVRRQELEDEGSNRGSSIAAKASAAATAAKSSQRRQEKIFQADQFVAMSRSLTTKILGTDSPSGEHEVWAEVVIPNYDHLFSIQDNTTTIDTTTTTTAVTPGFKVHNSTQRSKEVPLPQSPRTDIQRLLILDQILDPGNMGLIVRSAKAFSWDAAWHTPGTVDQYNNKVVRASRALCLDWPTKTGSWKELEKFVERKDLTLLVADMVPGWISDRAVSDAIPTSTSVQDNNDFNLYNLVWWNWPKSLPRTRVPERIALVMSSEHHGVKGKAGSFDKEDQGAKARLLSRAIRVSIPMNPDVESMNVAAAATAMMWELNRVIDEGKRGPSKLQVFDTSE
ncbi:hypothetical protein BGZ79_010701 [Entomortierella chlamydospora]|nr:hypothetical protein BGZ79_010701 [Entomortierella chlamydospora]